MIPDYWQKASRSLARGDPVMAALVRRYKGMSLVSRGDAFGTLARSIAGQQISVKAADAVWGRFSAVVGSVSPDATSEVLAIADHVGNILLETSIEYRKRWSTNWEWAAFIDAGNVWTYAALPDLAGAEFKFNRFYKEFAVGAGLGLRYGISFLVIRLDLAMPIVKPWLPEGERWVLGAIRPFSPEWRKENLVLNFSVGYPF